MLKTLVLIEGSSKEKLAQNFTWIGDNLGAPDAYGMGLDIDAWKRQVDKISSPPGGVFSQEEHH